VIFSLCGATIEAPESLYEEIGGQAKTIESHYQHFIKEIRALMNHLSVNG